MVTRRAKAKSAKYAVVVRFSKSRGRYERQGLLVEPQALADAHQELAEPIAMSKSKPKPVMTGRGRLQNAP